MKRIFLLAVMGCYLAFAYLLYHRWLVTEAAYGGPIEFAQLLGGTHDPGIYCERDATTTAERSRSDGARVDATALRHGLGSTLELVVETVRAFGVRPGARRALRRAHLGPRRRWYRTARARRGP